MLFMCICALALKTKFILGAAQELIKSMLLIVGCICASRFILGAAWEPINIKHIAHCLVYLSGFIFGAAQEHIITCCPLSHCHVYLSLSRFILGAA